MNRTILIDHPADLFPQYPAKDVGFAGRFILEATVHHVSKRCKCPPGMCHTSRLTMNLRERMDFDA